MDFSTSTTSPNSASPQHNPQAASVFGLHEFSFSSIEQLPNVKASMAFVLDSGTVFREDTKLDSRVLNGGHVLSLGVWITKCPTTSSRRLRMMRPSPPRVNTEKQRIINFLTGLERNGTRSVFPENAVSNSVFNTGRLAQTVRS